ncbi:MAG: hypothetical protein AB1765_03785 [Candidatus Hydrogenedentota bacterium]
MKFKVFFYALIISLIINLPYLMGLILTPEDSQYLHYTASVNNYDQLYSIDCFHQGMHRIFKTINLYSTEKERFKRFAPFYPFCGFVFKSAGFNIDYGFTLLRIVSTIIFISVLYYSLTVFLEGAEIWRCLLFILFSGCFYYVSYIDTNTFLSIYLHPHLAISLSLVLLILSRYYKLEARSKMQDARCARQETRTQQNLNLALLCCCIFVLSFVHTYMLIPVILFCLIYCSFLKRSLIPLLFTILFSSPGIIYHFYTTYLSYTKPEFHFKSAYIFPNLFITFGLYGLPFFLAIYFWFTTDGRSLLKNNKILRFCSVWFFVFFILSFVPLYFGRRFVISTHMALSIMGFVFIEKKLLPNRKIIASFLIFLAVLPTLFFYARQFYNITLNKNSYYISSKENNIIKYLRNYYRSHPKLMCSEYSGMLYPPFTGCTAFSSGWEFTSFWVSKKEIINIFYSPKTDNETRKNILRKYNIKFVLYTPNETGPRPEPWPDLSGFLEPVIDENKYKLFLFTENIN